MRVYFAVAEVITATQGIRRMMRGITILSPHRDDAAFSLCLCLLRRSQRGIPLCVLNFFTQSDYAPRAAIAEDGLQKHRAISLLREKEDRNVLFGMDRSIHVKDFEFLDAPLRLGIEWNAVCGEGASLRQDEHTIEDLRVAISRCIRNRLVLAPLALGDHVDHLAVRSAAMAASNGSKTLGFYEDLPYAIWTPEQVLYQHVQEMEERTGVLLRPIVIRESRAIWKKRRIISGYRSQIGHREADDIARFASQYRGGERVWIPKNSGQWRRFLASEEVQARF